MSGHDTAVLVARVLTIVTTIMLRIALLPDFNRWRKARNTGDMSVMPSVLLYTNCYALLFYAYVIDDMLPLFFTSVLGVLAGGILAFFFYRWTDHKRDVMRIFIGSFVVCVLVTIYSALAISGVTGQSHSSQSTTLGFITITTTVGMYGSPMTTIARVVRTKTSSSMPFTMGVVVVFNSFCWGFYAALVDNWFILAPNIVGFTLGSIQLILTFIYPRADAQVVSASVVGCADPLRLSVVVVSPVQGGEEDKKSSFLDSQRSQSYVALQSPCRSEGQGVTINRSRQ